MIYHKTVSIVIADLSRAESPSNLRVAFLDADARDGKVSPGARSFSPDTRGAGSPMGRSLTPGSEGFSDEEEEEGPVRDILNRLGSARIGSARHRLALELAALNGDIPPEYHPDYRPDYHDDRSLSPGSRIRSAGSRIKSAGARSTDGHLRAKSPYDRGSSPTMTIYSDHGSEWTVPAPDDNDLARLDDILEEEERRMKQMRDSWAQGYLKPRPSSATASTSQARPNTPQGRHSSSSSCILTYLFV